MQTILLKNGRLWDGYAFQQGDILIEGRFITRIATHLDVPTDFLFDASGKIVSTGLIDAHIHMRGISEDAIGIFADLGTIPFGVTSAADASGIHGNKQILDAFAVQSMVFVHVPIRGDQPDFSNTETQIQRYGDRAAGLKVYYDAVDGGVSSIRPLKQIVDFAERIHQRIMVHSSHSPVPMMEIVSVLRLGDILTHAYHGGNHSAAQDDFACIRLAKEKGVVVDVGFAGHVHTDFGILRDGIRRGAFPDLISTDLTCWSAYKRGGRYGLTMCMSIARDMGMSEEDVLCAVTSAPAKALGKSNEWGRLAAGRRADIAVLEYGKEGYDLTDAAGNHIHSPNGYRCLLTIADGAVAYRA